MGHFPSGFRITKILVSRLGPEILASNSGYVHVYTVQYCTPHRESADHAKFDPKK